MSFGPAPTPSSRGGYKLAAILGALTVAIVTIMGTIIFRAMIGYSITPIAFGDEVAVTLTDRSVALWATPTTAGATCDAVDTDTGVSSLHRSESVTMTVSDRGNTWTRIGMVVGQSGSTHTVTCSGSGEEQVGFAPNPQIANYFKIWLVGGGIALASAVASIVLLIRTNRRNRAEAAPA